MKMVVDVMVISGPCCQTAGDDYGEKKVQLQRGNYSVYNVMSLIHHKKEINEDMFMWEREKERKKDSKRRGKGELVSVFG